jgi:Asp-tRNA(Asn)/Glu-tRNA(Gln) amidotransferase C subunit
VIHFTALPGRAGRLEINACGRDELMDHLADVKKYTASVDEAAVAGLSKTYALVMSKADTRYVAASDPEEVKRVVENFCKKKLGRKESDADLTAVVKAQCEKMKADKTKSRITVYYLVAEHFKQLAMFHPK